MRSKGRPASLPVYFAFTLFLALNVGLWAKTHMTRPVWNNVPPVMSDRAALAASLGDRELSYRMNALMLQSLGNSSGDVVPLKDYDYNTLKDWFFLQDRLDPLSDYTPYLAAYYFSATQSPKTQLGPVIDYLEVAGLRPQPNKWRWLAQATFLARFRLGDMQRALTLANELAALKRDDMPIWAKSMPAFVLSAAGDRQAAYALMMGILSSSAKTLSPQEILFLQDNICNHILTPAQAAKNALCTAGK